MAEATYYGEELEVCFSASVSVSDYGVPGSPTFVEIDDVTIDGVTLLGVEVAPDVYKAWPKELKDALYALADEIDEGEWGVVD